MSSVPMLSSLVKKEMRSYFLDSRFLVVFGLCILLSSLSVHVGGRNYVRHVGEHSEIVNSHRKTL